MCLNTNNSPLNTVTVKESPHKLTSILSWCRDTHTKIIKIKCHACVRCICIVCLKLHLHYWVMWPNMHMIKQVCVMYHCIYSATDWHYPQYCFFVVVFWTPSVQNSISVCSKYTYAHDDSAIVLNNFHLIHIIYHRIYTWSKTWQDGFCNMCNIYSIINLLNS